MGEHQPTRFGIIHSIWQFTKKRKKEIKKDIQRSNICDHFELTHPFIYGIVFRLNCFQAKFCLWLLMMTLIISSAFCNTGVWYQEIIWCVFLFSACCSPFQSVTYLFTNSCIWNIFYTLGILQMGHEISPHKYNEWPRTRKEYHGNILFGCSYLNRNKCTLVAAQSFQLNLSISDDSEETNYDYIFPIICKTILTLYQFIYFCCHWLVLVQLEWSIICSYRRYLKNYFFSYSAALSFLHGCQVQFLDLCDDQIQNWQTRDL